MRRKRWASTAGKIPEREFLRVGSHAAAGISDASGRGRRRAAPIDATRSILVAGAHAEFRRDDGQS